MNTPPRDGLVKTRRDFLRTSMLGAATSWTVPGFVQSTFTSMHAHAAQSAVQVADGRDAPILVILQLAGGNDGLNTLVPHADDAYHQARKRLALARKDLLDIDDHFGLHPKLAFMHRSLKEGQLAAVHGVGYPNPNRSHFRSTEIWTRATDADRVGSTGWVGRYFDNACQGMDPTVGVALVDRQPDAFVAEKRPGVALKTPELYSWMQGAKDDASAKSIFREVNAPEETAGNSIDMAAGGNSGGPALATAADALRFLERTALDAQVSSDRIREIMTRSKIKTSYPGTPLARSLQVVARMIEGRLPTRVFYVSHGGFDTHANQLGSHAIRLQQLDEALAAFFKDIKAQDESDRVLLMTFSEFGRRVQENANGGTDHGAAAPLFLLGGPVKGGLHGKVPSLTDLNKGDLKFSTDFRSVYATILEKWLQTDHQPILGRKFPVLDFLG